MYFLKTHTTTSGTIGSVFLSYRIKKKKKRKEKEKQKFFFDPDLAERKRPALLELNKVPRLVQSDEAYKLLDKPINLIFPKTKAKYITVVDNPLDRVSSAMMYYRWL